MTHECTAKHSTNHIIKFEDDIAAVGLISDSESSHRKELEHLVDCYPNNIFSLNVDKINWDIDSTKSRTDHLPKHINGSPVEIVRMETFLGLHITCTTPRKHSTLCAVTDEGKLPPPNPIHILQRNNCKHPNNMVWKLQWFRPQGPAMAFKNSWENYWKLTLSNIRYLPQMVCEQDSEHHIGPQMSLQWTLCPFKKASASMGPTQRDFATFFPP